MSQEPKPRTAREPSPQELSGLQELHRFGFCGGYMVCRFCPSPRDLLRDDRGRSGRTALAVAVAAIAFILAGAIVCGLLIQWGWGPR